MRIWRNNDGEKKFLPILVHPVKVCSISTKLYSIQTDSLQAETVLSFITITTITAPPPERLLSVMSRTQQSRGKKNKTGFYSENTSSLSWSVFSVVCISVSFASLVAQKPKHRTDQKSVICLSLFTRRPPYDNNKNKRNKSAKKDHTHTPLRLKACVWV